MEERLLAWVDVLEATRHVLYSNVVEHTLKWKISHPFTLNSEQCMYVAE